MSERQIESIANMVLYTVLALAYAYMMVKLGACR